MHARMQPIDLFTTIVKHVEIVHSSTARRLLKCFTFSNRLRNANCVRCVLITYYY